MIELGKIPLSTSVAVEEARARVLQLAAEMGFDDVTATRIATATSEMGRQLLKETREPSLSVAIRNDTGHYGLWLCFAACDGIPNPPLLSRVFEVVEPGQSDGLAGLRVFKRQPSARTPWGGRFINEQTKRISRRSRAELLSEIKAQNESLEQHKVRLEETVAVRTVELRDALAEVENNRRFLQSILENSPVHIFVKGLDGRYLLMNPPLAEKFGFERGEIIGKTDREAFSLEKAKIFEETDRQVVDARRSLEFEDVEQHEGESRTYLSLKFPILDDDGIPQAICGIASDITERKQMEEELLSAREVADAASRAKSEFLSNMSHELRTPLNGVLGYVQILLRDRSFSQRQRTSLESIRSCGEHLLTLINDVLDLSKIEAGKMEIDNAACNLPQLLRSVTDIVSPKAESKGLKFILEAEVDLPLSIETDAMKLRQVLINLAGNAVKFTDKGSVTLKADHSENTLTLTVADTGIGMTSDELEQIFDPFKQAQGGKTSGGTGLGLSISKRMIEAMQGQLDVTSTLGTGSSFGFSIPLVEPRLEESPAELLIDAEDLRLEGGQEFRILVADDGPENRDILCQLLESAGFSTVQACDGVEALEVLRKEPVDLALMDVRMPRMSGIEAVAEIRKDSDLKDLVVVAVTASVLPEFRNRALESGFNDFLPKPFRASQIFSIFGEHLGVRFESDSQEAPVAETPVPSASDIPDLPREEAAAIAARLRNGAAMGDISDLEALADQLSSDTATSGLSQRIHQLTAGFELDSLASLADQLSSQEDEAT